MKIEITSTKFDVDAKEFKLVMDCALKLDELESSVQYGRNGVADRVIEAVASNLTREFLSGHLAKEVLNQIDLSHIVRRIELQVVNNFTTGRN